MAGAAQVVSAAVAEAETAAMADIAETVSGSVVTPERAMVVLRHLGNVLRTDEKTELARKAKADMKARDTAMTRRAALGLPETATDAECDTAEQAPVAEPSRPACILPSLHSQASVVPAGQDRAARELLSLCRRRALG